MKIRLILLLVVFAGLAVALAAKVAKPPAPSTQPVPDDEVSPAVTKPDQKSLSERELPGKEMKKEAEVSVRVSVDPTPNKNRLLFELTEAHGYYVETFSVLVWYKSTPDMEREDAPWGTDIFFDKYIPPNGTLTFCAPLVPAELGKVGGEMGTSENWGAEVRWIGRARTKEEAPNPLPKLAVASEECN